MRTATVCALLAALAWLVSIGSAHHDVAMVFAVVWTGMAVAYAGRAWRHRAGAVES